MATINTVHNYNYLKATMIAAAVRSATLRLVYKHALKLKSGVLSGSTATGKLIGVAATDTELFDFLALMMFVPLGPLGLVISTVILYFVFGPAGLVGAFTLILLFVCMILLSL